MKYPTTWAEWEKMYVNLELWNPIIVDVLKREGIEYEKISLPKYPGTHAVFQIDNQFIIKFYTPLSPKDFIVESSIYKSLTSLGRAEFFPRLCVVGNIQCPARWNYIIINVVEGLPYREVEEKMSGEENEEMAKSLAQALKDYHQSGWKKENIPKWQLDSNDHLSLLERKLVGVNQLSEALIGDILSFVKRYEPNSSLSRIVVHADVTADHVYLTNRENRWMMTGLIDVADSKVSSVLLEFPAIWFELFKGNVDLMKLFFRTYDSSLQIDGEMRNSLMYITLIHQFGISMIEQTLTRKKIGKVHSFEELVNLLWPETLFDESHASSISRNLY